MPKNEPLQRIGWFVLLLILAACTVTPDMSAANLPVSTATMLPETATDVPTPKPSLPLVNGSTTIDASAQYLFYLHGKIIEDQGLPAVSPDYGAYEYEAIIETLQSHGFVVRSEQRAKDTDVQGYAVKIAGQVKELLDAGVPAEKITIVGASKGAGIAIYVSHLLKNNQVNYVLLAICHPDVVSELIQDGISLSGNVLSIYDGIDEYAGSCEDLFAFSEGKELSSHAELVLDVGTGHGALYQPLDEWVLPAVSWAAHFGIMDEVRPEFGKYFDDYPGAFVLYDLNRDRYIRYNPERCAEGFLPASTFKILNSLIGLETGVIPDENFVIPWDGTNYNIPPWHQDHTLQSAIQNSVVWYYQELARRVGAEQMRAYVEAAAYGNADISGSLDSFWLDGALRISADQQIDFLRRLYTDDLPFSQRSIDIVKKIIVLEDSEAYQLSGKTGSTVRVQVYQGWFVGYVERGGEVYFFATNFESDDANGFANGENAKRITLEILAELGLLD